MLNAFDTYWNTAPSPAAASFTRDLLVGALAVVLGAYLIRTLKV